MTPRLQVRLRQAENDLAIGIAAAVLTSVTAALQQPQD